jgi:hypothetical protein
MAGRKSSVRFVVKFAEGKQAALRHGEFISSRGEDFSALNEWLRRYRPSEIFSLFAVSPASEQEASVMERDLGLDRFFCIVLETEVRDVESRLGELNGLPFLEEAYVEAPTQLAEK